MKSIKNEGWLISLNTITNKLEIQKNDDSNKFKNDEEAIEFVRTKSKKGSLIHKMALLKVGAIFEVNIGFNSHLQVAQMSINILEGKGNKEGKKIAREEILRLAEIVQHYYEKQQVTKKKAEAKKRAMATKQLDDAFGVLGLEDVKNNHPIVRSKKG